MVDPVFTNVAVGTSVTITSGVEQMSLPNSRNWVMAA